MQAHSYNIITTVQLRYHADAQELHVLCTAGHKNDVLKTFRCSSIHSVVCRLLTARVTGKVQSS